MPFCQFFEIDKNHLLCIINDENNFIRSPLNSTKFRRLIKPFDVQM
jgi:hypothetical protein